jgi:hypothetical protein
MKNYAALMLRCLWLLLCFGLLASAAAQAADEEDRDRIKYGLSQPEWESYKRSGIPKSKLEKLLKYGITFNEYASKPWISLGVSEPRWIEERGKGLKNEDIKAFHQESTTSDADLFIGLLPSVKQFGYGEYAKASIMLAVFPVSAALYWFIKTEVPPPAANLLPTTKRYPEFFLLILGDIIWSVIDVNRHRALVEFEARPPSLPPEIQQAGPAAGWQVRLVANF